MKKKLLFVITVVFMFVISAYCSWDVSTSIDEMTGEKEVYASSSRTSPTKSMSFPYNDVEAWIGIGSNGDREWAYIGFSTSPHLNNTTRMSEDGNDRVDLRVKWDDELSSMRLRHESGSRYLTFKWSDYREGFVSNVAKHNTLLLEVDWYGQGKVYFKFSLEGSAIALKKMRNQARK